MPSSEPYQTLSMASCRDRITLTQSHVHSIAWLCSGGSRFPTTQKGVDSWAPPTIVRLKNALNGLKQAPQLWHNDINSYILFLRVIQSQGRSNLIIRIDGILSLLPINDVCMMSAHTESTRKAVIEVKAKFSVKYKITTLSVVR
jgi:hypothetical protein